MRVMSESTAATTSTVKPADRAVAAVTGPMQATKGGTMPGATATKLVTVDDDVLVGWVDWRETERPGRGQKRLRIFGVQPHLDLQPLDRPACDGRRQQRVRRREYA